MNVPKSAIIATVCTALFIVVEYAFLAIMLASPTEGLSEGYIRVQEDLIRMITPDPVIIGILWASLFVLLLLLSDGRNKKISGAKR